MRSERRNVCWPTDRYPFSHASALALDTSGSLRCFWFSGSLEGHADVVIRKSNLVPNAHGRHAGPYWVTPSVAIDHQDLAVGNPVPVTLGDDRLTVIYTTFPPRRAREARLLMRNSMDGGDSWTEMAPPTSKLGYWPRHPPVSVHGVWILPLFNNRIRPPRSMVWLSFDEGRSWREVSVPLSEGLIQPCIVLTKSGMLHMYLRDMHCRAIYRSESVNCGESWSVPEAVALPNNNSGISVVRLVSGALMVAYNDETRQERRSRLTVAISDDDGDTWPVRRVIAPYEDVEASRMQISYPSLLEDAEGLIHMSLTHRSSEIVHHSFDEAWVRNGQTNLAVPPAELFAQRAYDLRRLRVGETVYLGDKRVVLKSVPELLENCLVVCPLRAARQSHTLSGYPLRIVLNRAAELIVAFPAERPVPDWLTCFRPIHGVARTSDGVYLLRGARFEAGEHILGNELNVAWDRHERWFAFVYEGKHEIRYLSD